MLAFPGAKFLYAQFEKYCSYQADETALDVVDAVDLMDGIDRLTLLEQNKNRFFDWFRSLWSSTPTRNERINNLKKST
jgi:Zn-dependent protease with chaperone function